MATSQENSYPSPEQAQMNDGGTHPFYAGPQQQQAPQAVMDPQHQQHEQSTHSNQMTETYPPREGDANREMVSMSFPNNQDHSGFAIQQMQQHMDANGTPMIKRPKTSRACDQCRSKKTRCDEIPGSNGTQCVSCRRNNQMCEFSREPQKRGPSKGYIKELAERVGALESGYPPSPGSQFPSASTSAPFHSPLSYPITPTQVNPNKRTFSVSEGLRNPSSLQAQVQGSAHGLPGSESNASSKSTSDQRAHLVDRINIEAAMASYYAKLHPFAPFLPHMAVRLLGNLQGSSEPVARALTSALEAFANPAEHRLIPFQSDTDGKDDFANRVFSLQLIPGSSQTLAEKLSSLQATLLMAFAVEICNPVNAGYSGWFSQAYAISKFLFQSSREIRYHKFSMNDDPDAHHMLARRSFLTLALAERWNAAGTSNEALISEEYLGLIAPDKSIMGDFAYYLLRASFILNHITSTILTRKTSVDLWLALSAEKDRFIEDLETNLPVLNYLPVFLNLFFLHHASSVHSDRYPPSQAVQAAIALIRMLMNQHTRPYFMYNHHCVALSIMVLDDALRKNEAPEEARKVLEQLHDGLTSGNITILDGAPWTGVITRFITSSLSAHDERPNGEGEVGDRAGLQHLADAAVGETEAGGNSEQVASEHTVTAPVGYLLYAARYA